MKSFKLSLLLFAMLSGHALAADNIVVVVSKKSPLTKLTNAQVKALYLGETRYAVPGVQVELHDRDRSTPIFKEFYSRLAAMSAKQVTVHWSRKVFTGEAPPPVRDSGDDAAVIEAIKDRAEAINYVYEKSLSPSAKVKVVYSLAGK
jgi:ABC-type phosphate transport system substrate-binding protein